MASLRLCPHDFDLKLLYKCIDLGHCHAHALPYTRSAARSDNINPPGQDAFQAHLYRLPVISATRRCKHAYATSFASKPCCACILASVALVSGLKGCNMTWSAQCKLQLDCACSWIAWSWLVTTKSPRPSAAACPCCMPWTTLGHTPWTSTPPPWLIMWHS